MALCHSQVSLILTLQKPHIPASFNMNLVINKCVTAVEVSNFTCHYLRNPSTLDIGVLGYTEVWSVPPVTPCIYTHPYIHTTKNLTSLINK